MAIYCPYLAIWVVIMPINYNIIVICIKSITIYIGSPDMCNFDISTSSFQVALYLHMAFMI